MLAFQKSLADGHHIEQSVVEDICQLLALDVSELSEIELEKAGVEVEFYIDASCALENVVLPSQLTDVKKTSLIREVAAHLCNVTNNLTIPDAQLSVMRDACVQEMSRIEAYLYRDWQSALGDLVIREVSNEERKYEVIGYKAFEELYDSTDLTVKKWISRADKVFNNLDVRTPNKYDDRRTQLRQLYQSTYSLLKTLSRNKTSNVNVAKKAIKDLTPKIP
jgi:hypothetical protein